MRCVESVSWKLVWRGVWGILGVSSLFFLAEILRTGSVVDHPAWSRPRHSSPRFSARIDGHKTILFWTQYFSRDFDASCPHRKQAEDSLEKCSAKNCFLTEDKNLLNQSAAVIFHFRDLFPETPLPSHRSPDQFFLFYLLESPLHSTAGVPLQAVEGFFNLTFTYRLDSDLPNDFYFKNFAPPLWKHHAEMAKSWRRKTNFAAIFFSYCHAPSLRNYYLNELQQYIPLHLFGSCGTKTCDITNATFCDDLVGTYKFYLAFENSICKDYMTEKVYRALNHGSIPVVYGGANYTSLLPANSFINILDFANARSLADHLLFLANDENEYAKYFTWRFNATSTVLPERLRPENMSWCRLCKMLNEHDRSAGPRTERVVRNLTEWWHQSAHCVAPNVSFVDGQIKWLKNPIVDFT